MLGDGTSTLAVEDLAKFMINISDNTAANMVIDEVGMENVNKLIVSLGFKEMKLRRHMMDSPAQARGDDNTATPAEGAEIMARISRCELPLSEDSAEKFGRSWRFRRSRILRRDPIPRQIPIAFKWGGNEGVSTAWAIVNQPGRPYVMSIMTTYAGDAAPTVRAFQPPRGTYYWRLARANPYGARVLR